MANSSRVPAMIAQLVTQLDAALDVPVFDGPAFGDDARSSWLEVGIGDPNDPEGVAATSRMEWRGLGARSRDEEIEIFCAAWAWTGDDGLTAPRALAYELAAEAEAALVADPSLGGVALFGGVSELTLRQGYSTEGATVGVMFQVRAKARLSV